MMMLTTEIRAVIEAFMVTFRCKGWEGDWAYQEAKKLLDASVTDAARAEPISKEASYESDQ